MQKILNMAAIGLGTAFTILWGTADPMVAFAEVRQVEVTGRYFIGETAENFAEARSRAKEDALRMAAEQVSVLVESYSETQGMVLTKDEIQSIAAAILSVKRIDYKFETDSENHITVLCHIMATADSDAITADMLRERNPIRREAQIAEYEQALGEVESWHDGVTEKQFAAWDKLAALEPSNLKALQFAYIRSLEDDGSKGKFMAHLEKVYASHTRDLEVCGYLGYLHMEANPPEYERAAVYANKGIAEAKKRYSQEEIKRIVNSSYVEYLTFGSDLGDDILFNPVYLSYMVKCQSMDELLGNAAPQFTEFETIGDRMYVHYKTDW